MPRLHEGTEVSGRLRPEVAARLGLPAGIPVAAGGGDGGTGAVGVGCIENGEGFISLGTAAVYVVAADRYAPKPETMLHDFAHAVPGRWFQMAGMLNGASALSSTLQSIGESDIEGMLHAVEARYRGPSRLLFLPYLTGERTPHNNPDARGVLFGLDPETEKADIVQAVLEGVAFSLRDAAECLEAAGQRLPFARLHRRRRAEPVLGEDHRRRDRPDAPALSRRRFRPGARRGPPRHHRRHRRERRRGLLPARGRGGGRPRPGAVRGLHPALREVPRALPGARAAVLSTSSPRRRKNLGCHPRESGDPVTTAEFERVATSFTGSPILAPSALVGDDRKGSHPLSMPR